jgi:flavin-binding protein dodecin
MASVARVTEISSVSETSFEDAIKIAVERASQTLRGLRTAWVKEQEAQIGEGGQIIGYKVNLLVTFVLE